MEAKDNLKQDVDQIKRPAASKDVTAEYGSINIPRVPCKKKARTVVLEAARKFVRRPPRIKVLSATACFAIRLECLSANIN